MTVEMINSNDLQQIRADVNRIAESIGIIRSSLLMPESVSISDIARLKGISRTNLTTSKQWLMPFNSKRSKVYTSGTKRWSYEEYMNWVSVSEEIRKENFLKKTHREA